MIFTFPFDKEKRKKKRAHFPLDASERQTNRSFSSTVEFWFCVCWTNGISFYVPFWLLLVFLSRFLYVIFCVCVLFFSVCIVTGDTFQACKKYLLFKRRSKSNIWHENWCAWIEWQKNKRTQYIFKHKSVNWIWNDIGGEYIYICRLLL